MATYGGSKGDSQYAGGGSGEYVFIQKRTLAVGNYPANSRYVGSASLYGVKTDINETPGAVVEVSIYTQSEGEAPQLQAIVSTTAGGGGKGQTMIHPRATIHVNTVVSGASQSVGITGL